MYTLSQLISPLLDAPETNVRATTVPARADGYLAGTSGLMNTYNTTLMTSRNVDSEARSIIEFELASVPRSAVITHVAFEGYIEDYHIAAGHDSLTLEFYGYTGDGVVTADDAAAGSLVGSLTVPASRAVGPVTVTLLPEAVQRALAVDYMGLHLRVTAPDAGARITYLLLRSLRNTNERSAPALIIQYVLPAPKPDTYAIADEDSHPDPADSSLPVPLSKQVDI